jgi:hypothetical protein
VLLVRGGCWGWFCRLAAVPEPPGAEARSGRRVGRRLAHGEFLEEKLVAGLEERGERTSVAKVNTDVGELLVKAANDVENESTIGDLLAKNHPGHQPWS